MHSSGRPARSAIAARRWSALKSLASAARIWRARSRASSRRPAWYSAAARSKLRVRGEPVEGERGEQLHAVLEAGLVDVEARTVVGRSGCQVAVRVRAADEEEESRNRLLVEREVLRAADLVHHVHVGVARDAPERRRRP